MMAQELQYGIAIFAIITCHEGIRQVYHLPLRQTQRFYQFIVYYWMFRCCARTIRFSVSA